MSVLDRFRDLLPEIFRSSAAIGVTPDTKRLQVLHARMKAESAALCMTAGEFERELETTRCKEIFEKHAGMSDHSPAGFTIYSDGRFQNKIYYDPQRLDIKNEQDLFLFRAHEGIHAIQLSKAPALHAIPGNGLRLVYLSPRDLVWLNSLAEREAYSKTAMLIVERYFQLGVDISPESASWSKSNVDAHTYLRCWKQAKSKTNKALVLTAGEMMQGENREEYYQLNILRHYRDYMECTEKLPKPQIVRVERRDIAAINSFGPKLFSSFKPADHYARTPPKLCSEAEKLVSDINDMLGIKDERQLPTFREALEQRGLTPERFMAISRGDLPRPPGLEIFTPD